MARPLLIAAAPPKRLAATTILLLRSDMASGCQVDVIVVSLWGV